MRTLSFHVLCLWIDKVWPWSLCATWIGKHVNGTQVIYTFTSVKLEPWCEAPPVVPLGVNVYRYVIGVYSSVTNWQLFELWYGMTKGLTTLEPDWIHIDLVPWPRWEINVECTINPLQSRLHYGKVHSNRERGTSFTHSKLQLFKTVGRAEQVGVVVAHVDLTSLCRSHMDCLVSECTTFQRCSHLNEYHVAEASPSDNYVPI